MGGMRTCQSAFLAVRGRDRIDHHHQFGAGAPCASAMNGQWCRLLLSGCLMAQRMMYFEWTKLSGSTAAVGPQDMKKALIAAESPECPFRRATAAEFVEEGVARV